MSAILLIDPKGELLFANNVAEDILRENDGFVYRGRKVCLADDSQQSEFYRLVHECITTSRGEALYAGGGLSVLRPSEKPFYRTVVTPLNMRSEHKRLDPLAAVAVFIYDSSQLHVPSGELLQSMYGMTEAEVRVAHLFYQCFNLQKIAEELGLKVSTVRSHLYRIFEKTEASSQVELMKLLDQIPREASCE